jgi:hypothetical protein
MIHEHEELIASEVEGAGCVDDFEMTTLGNRLMEIRKKFDSECGKLFTPEE